MIRFDKTTRSFAIATPLNTKLSETKKYRLIYKFDRSNKVTSKMEEAKSPSEAINKLKMNKLRRELDSKTKDGNPTLIKAYESPSQDDQAQKYGQFLMDKYQQSKESKSFSYKGFKNRKEYFKNKIKRFFGKKGAVKSSTEWERRAKNVGLTNLRMKSKISAYNSGIKKIDKSYRPNKYSSTVAKVVAPIAAVPIIPGTATGSAVIVGSAALADQIKMQAIMKKNPELKDLSKEINQSKKLIESKEKNLAKIQKLEDKKRKLQEKINNINR